MILNHVTKNTGRVVVSSAPFDSDGFGISKLNMIYISAVPYRLEDAVRKSEDQQILNGLFPEIMIDAVDLLLGKLPRHFLV